MAFTWWAVISVIVGGIIRIEYVTPEYEFTFGVASVVYGFGWYISVLGFALQRSNDKDK